MYFLTEVYYYIILDYRAFINKSDHQVMKSYNYTLWFAHQCNAKIYLWTDNATIGVIEPVEGIQFKHLDRQVYIWAASSSGYSQFNGILYFSINYTLADVINNGDAGVLSDILKYEVTWGLNKSSWQCLVAFQIVYQYGGIYCDTDCVR